MKLEIVPYDALPCALATFTINDMDASADDFGSGCDDSPEEAEEYGCGDHQFHAKMPTQKILDKYKITPDEYSEICAELESRLYVGSCGWCV
jgi:hypothetical protein